jgi:hypothetical protein
VKIHYISASRLKKYLQCTQAYYYAYEEGIKSSAPHLTFGVVVHKVLERYFQEDMDIEEIFKEEYKGHDILGLTYYEEGLEIVRNFASNTDKNEVIPMGFEKAFAINIRDNIVYDTDSVDFSDKEQAKAFLQMLEEQDAPIIFGFIDRIDYDAEKDILKISDYKTSRVALTQDEAETDEQLSMYALVSSYLYSEFENVELELHYVRSGLKVRTTRTKEYLDSFREWLINIYGVIKDDDNPVPKLNRYCGWCDAKDKCPAYQELILKDYEDVKLPPIEACSDEELDELLEDLKVHIKILKSKEKEVEDYFKSKLTHSDNSPIEVNGGVRYLSQSPRTNYNVNTVITLFPEKFESLVTVKKAEVDKLAKGNDEALTALSRTSSQYSISPTLQKKKSKK